LKRSGTGPRCTSATSGSGGCNHLIYEVVDNSVDEALAGVCDEITVTIHADDEVSILDNGRGIPVDIHPTEKRSALDVVLTVLHSGAKFEHKVYKISGGLHGVGLSVVNALSEHLTAEVFKDGKAYRMDFEARQGNGRPQGYRKTKQRGTLIRFKPDKQIFKTVEFKGEIIMARMRELAYLNKDLKINLKDERTGTAETFHYPNGLADFVKFLDTGRIALHKPVMIEEDRNGMHVDVAFEYNDGYVESIFSFANTINTHEGGTHLSGFKSALTRTLGEYARKSNALKEGDELTGEDTARG